MNSEEQARKDLTQIFRAALEAVAPDRLTAMALRGELDDAETVPDIITAARRVFVLAVGKAASGMMVAAEQHLGGRISDAVAVVPPADLEHDTDVRVARLHPGGHPLPDDNSIKAAQAVLTMLDGIGADDLLLGLLSGGASAMVAAPADSVTLED